MFGTDGVKAEVEFKTSPYLRYGIQNVKINSFDVKAAVTGATQIIANVEGRPVVDDDSFEADKASTAGGKVGRVAFTIYMNPEKPSYQGLIDTFNTDIATLAEKLGKRDASNPDAFNASVKAATIEEYATKLTNVLGGQFFWLGIKGEEYTKADAQPGDKPGVTLVKRRFSWVASEDEGEGHLKPFDKSSQYDYKTVEKPDAPVAEKSDEVDDLPF